jgi:hypothetical protein
LDPLNGSQRPCSRNPRKTIKLHLAGGTCFEEAVGERDCEREGGRHSAVVPRHQHQDRPNGLALWGARDGVMTSGWCIHPGGPQGYYLDCSVFLLASTWIQAAAQFPTRYTDA